MIRKAPHHTASSWGGHWSNNHNMPDKILAHYEAEMDASGSDDSSLDSSSDDDSSDDSDAKEKKRQKTRPLLQVVHRRRRPSPSPLTSISDEGDEESWDVRDMGSKGGPYTAADRGICAQHIASFPDFRVLSAHDRWQSFSEKVRSRFCVSS